MIKSVTRNGRSIILTAILALILVYLFSIIGYLFFRDDFLMEVDPSLSLQASDIIDSNSSQDAFENDRFSCAANDSTCSQTNETLFKNSSVLMDLIKETQEISEELEDSIKERACDSLIMCIITTLNQGLRNGGGIGDVLRSPSAAEPLYVARVIYDLLFFFVVIIIILNLIFGVIIDTFADLRSEKQQKEEILKNTCFICGNLQHNLIQTNLISHLIILFRSGQIFFRQQKCII